MLRGGGVRRDGRGGKGKGEDVCCFAVREVINGVPGFASELPGSVLRSISREKSMQPHRWPHSLSIHKHAAAIHREFYARSQIPRRASMHMWTRSEYGSCGATSGSEQSLPEGTRTQEPQGWTRRRDSRGQMMVNKQTSETNSSTAKTTP